MAFDIFLELSGIDGESTIKGHEKEIAVVSYDQSIAASVVVSGGGGGAGAGKATFSGVRFRKLLDTASIPIALACASGLHIQSARFSFRRPGSRPFDFYVVTLEDVLVTHVGECASTDVQAPLKFETLAKSPAGAVLLEEVTLHFGRIRWEYRQIGPKGTALPPLAGGWDVNTNKKL
ncbi:MAG TPA: type VI secretion system tube protein Hcp [Steroidobacteraceae bacterium]|nr:type VI secretion system tube protein Hcp [Steroidobacteraceae bacterium]